MYAVVCSIGPEQPLTMGQMPWGGGGGGSYGFFFKVVHALGPSVLGGL